MTTNNEHAMRFAALLPQDSEDDRTNLIDILTDAMHWCCEAGEEFDEILRIAEMHFSAERSGEE